MKSSQPKSDDGSRQRYGQIKSVAYPSGKPLSSANETPTIIKMKMQKTTAPILRARVMRAPTNDAHHWRRTSDPQTVNRCSSRRPVHVQVEPALSFGNQLSLPAIEFSPDSP